MRHQIKFTFVACVLCTSSLFLFQNCGQFKADEIGRGFDKAASQDLGDNSGVPQKTHVKWQVDGSRTFLALSSDGLTLAKDDGAAHVARAVYADSAKDSGAWYFEGKIVSPISGHGLRLGVAGDSGRAPDGGVIADDSYGYDMSGAFYEIHQSSGGAQALTGALGAGDVIGVLYDFGSHQVSFYVNGSLVKTSGLPSGESFSPFIYGASDDNAVMTANFGAMAFSFPPVSIDFQAVDQ